MTENTRLGSGDRAVPEPATITLTEQEQVTVRLSEAAGALSRASEEIKALRRALEIAEAQLAIVDVFKRALAQQAPNVAIGMGEDIAWSCEREANAIGDVLRGLRGDG